MSNDLMKILVTDGEDTATVETFVSAYRQANPTMAVSAHDEGEWVFVGNQLSGLGINLDKTAHEEGDDHRSHYQRRYLRLDHPTPREEVIKRNT